MVKLMHWLVPLRHAVAIVCCPAARGPTLRDLVAMPPSLVVAAELRRAETLALVCHVTIWPATGLPLLSTMAWVVQLTIAPAARDSEGVTAARTGGVPPLK